MPQNPIHIRHSPTPNSVSQLFQVVAIREAMEDIARLESAVASGRAAPAEVEQLKHAADNAVEDLRCHVDSEALTAAARHEGLILHEVRGL